MVNPKKGTITLPVDLRAKYSVDEGDIFTTRHFIDDPEVSLRSGLRIGVPGDALACVREQLSNA